jgi:Kef-type K+ transport system membrane component KefB
MTITTTAGILVSLLTVFVAGKVGGELFERLRQPAVVGELLAGVIAGPAVLGLFHSNMTLETVSTMGVIVLMFTVGLETRASELLRVGRTALLVACLGVLVPFGGGLLFAAAFGFSHPEALFLGTALVATSVGVTARVLADRGLLSTRLAKIVLAAAVIDDILGMVVLSVVTGMTRGGFDVRSLAVVLVEVGAFIAFELFVAPWLVRRHGHYLERLRIANAPLAVALIVMLGMAATSEAIGLAGIVGAFFAGMMFAETSERWQLDRSTHPLYVWLVPYFFVLAGSQVDLSALSRPSVLLPGLLLVAIALVTKVIGCGIGALGEGPRGALAIGVAMVPRGEVGLIVASVGLASHVISPSVYGMVVLVVAVSTIVVPPVLPRLVKWSSKETGELEA